MRSEADRGILFLVAGVGLGMLAGLFWAPRPGRDLRSKLRSRATARWDTVAEESKNLRTEARRWLDIVKDRIWKMNGGATGNHSQ